MADSKRTTRKEARAARASTVKPLSPPLAVDILRRERHALEIARADFAHLANLIGVSGLDLARPGSSPEARDVGERVEFLSRMLHQQADGLRRAIDMIEHVADRLTGRPA